MRRVLTIAALALAVPLLAFGPPAQAATEKVAGTGSYKKLVIKNGNSNLVFKLKAPGGTCSIKYLTVKFRDRDGTRYAIDGGCYPGAVWGKSLVKGDTIKKCSDFSLKYATAKGLWTAKIPRSCLKGLGGAVKVTESYVDDYTPQGGLVPKTGYIKRG